MPHKCPAFQINGNATVPSSFLTTKGSTLLFRKWISRWLVDFLHQSKRPAMQNALLYHSVTCYVRWGNCSHLVWCGWITLTSRYCYVDERWILVTRVSYAAIHDDVIKWKHFPRYWPFVFPAQRPVTRSFDIFCDLRPYIRLSKQWWGDLRCYRTHYDVIVMVSIPGRHNLIGCR